MALAGCQREPASRSLDRDGELAAAGQGSARCRQLRRGRMEQEVEIQIIDTQLAAVSEIEQCISEDHRWIVRAGLAADHQVILFTCRPSTVGFARSVPPGGRVISPGSQNVSNPAAI